MSLKELELKKHYDSDDDDILRDFYIPVLSHSTVYKRLAGFFSSSSLAVAAKGISKLISNGGDMKLITGARLQKADVKAIKEAYEEPEKIIEKMMLEELDDLEDKFIRDHVRALGWMIANKKLDIKIAIIYENGLPLDEKSIEKRGIFHQKVGILEDSEGNKISFSGSDNESASAWQSNIEEFKVFRSWVKAEKEYLCADSEKFKKFWDGKSKRTKVMDIPIAIKEKLIEIAPDNFEKLNLEKWHIEGKVKKRKADIKLYEHQIAAVESWVTSDMQGIFEMATGTGKTFAALECLNVLLKKTKKLITVITCPYHHLITQWEYNMDKYGIELNRVIADSTNPKWRKEFVNYILDIKNGLREKIIVLTTHSTFSSKDFINILEDTANTGIDLFLIADEVHGLGAPRRKYGLIESYNFRLGLSATPKRWFDDKGTLALYEYFGEVIFSFTLKDAIYSVRPNSGETYLAPYKYEPVFIELNEDELNEYMRETEKIAKLYHISKSEYEKDELLKKILIRRSNIIKNAQNKFSSLIKILNELDENLKHCIIYCSPQQIDTVREMLRGRNIIYHKFTMEEGTNPEKKYGGISERDYILHKFAEREYQVLVAMRCLDEGVDVPPARIAILMASSGNPREYIQRIGRVIRRFPGKEKAIICDIVVVPTIAYMSPELRDIEWNIFEKELKRYEEIADASLNVTDVFEKLFKIKSQLRKYKSDTR